MVAVQTAQAVVVNFDDGTHGSAVGGFYSGQGVTFSNARWQVHGLPGGSTPLGIMSISGGTVFGFADRIIATFSTPVTTAQITGLDLGAAGLTMDAYDALVGGTQVDTDSAFGTGLGIGQFDIVVTSGSGISRIEMYQPLRNGIDGLVLDDLVFEPVPAPGAAVLAMIGLGAVRGIRRRRGMA